jgi:hypothetical protein
LGEQQLMTGDSASIYVGAPFRSDELTCSNTGGIEDLDREENQIDGRRPDGLLCLLSARRLLHRIPSARPATIRVGAAISQHLQTSTRVAAGTQEQPDRRIHRISFARA